MCYFTIYTVNSLSQFPQKDAETCWISDILMFRSFIRSLIRSSHLPVVLCLLLRGFTVERLGYYYHLCMIFLIIISNN